MQTNVIVVGSGGREHAIAWKIRQSKLVGKVFVAPGNGGTAEFNVPINADDFNALSEFAKENHCFTIVGPEGPLAAGIVDYFSKQGLPIFGPTKDEAMLETSKSYAKEFMQSHSIPTAKFGIFDDSQKAIDYSHLLEGRVAVKADGLAAGKGVFVCSSLKEAEDAIKFILDKKAFGDAGKKVVVEERLDGTECSLMTICNGKNALPFGSAKDHKRAFDADKGPNTGGMGAFSPTDDLDSKTTDEIMRRITIPTVRAANFHGFLYVGLMLTKDGPRVLEFNARLGDPETQAILPRLKSDLLSALLAMKESNSNVELEWSADYSCTVVMCSQGYPQTPKTGDRISGIQSANGLGVTVFHSGTQKRGEEYFTNGGRVLGVNGIGKSLPSAVEMAYSGVSMIKWNGEHHRNDIGRVA
ncbi:MAG: phosphoribosylamine--glycine ligase [Nitrososphaerales archaeon]